MGENIAKLSCIKCTKSVSYNMRNNKEYHLSKQLAQWLRLQYPDLLYRFDMAGLNLSKTQAGMNKAIQQSRGYPDLMIFRANKKYQGAFLELKTTTPYLKDGITLKKDEHLEEQAKKHEQLRGEGYWADFTVGFEHSRRVIEQYLKQ